MSLANLLVSLRALPFAQVTTEVGIADPRCGPVFGDTTRLQMAPRSFHQGPGLERTSVEHDFPVVSPICEHRSPAFGQRYTFAHHRGRRHRSALGYDLALRRHARCDHKNRTRNR